MFEGAEYYTRHNDAAEDPEVTFEDMPLNKFAAFVSEASRGGTDRVNDAIAKADSYCFQIANPEYLRTENNKRIIDHYLTTKGITCPTYPEFLEAFEHYKDSGLLDIDASELARDKRGGTYTGVFSKQTFQSVDDLIAAERHAALTQVTPISDVEKAFNALPPEQALNRLREAERATQQQINSAEVQDTADAWLMLHPEWRDDTRNAKLMKVQLKTNGVTQATIPAFEKTAQQLRDSGLVRLNQGQLDKQHAKQLQQRASDAAEQMRQPSEAEMDQLPLDEIRRRANGNFTGFGV